MADMFDVQSKRGSIWHRWDPHIHTPGTALNDQYAGLDPWAAFLDAIEVTVVEIGAHRWEYRLDAPATLLARVVVMLTRHRQQINHTLVQRNEGPRQAWKTLRQITDPSHLKTCVVDKYGTTLAACTDQCLSKGF